MHTNIHAWPNIVYTLKCAPAGVSQYLHNAYYSNKNSYLLIELV
jgi:hypothetical protein